MDDFCNQRNLKKGTRKGYESAIGKFEDFSGESIGIVVREALDEEARGMPLNDRKIRKRLIGYRTFLISGNMSSNSVKTYFSKIKTFLRHFGIEIPFLPPIKYEKAYETSYLDLPTKKHICRALEMSAIDFKAIVLFMASSGTAKAEALSLTVGDFIDAAREYHGGGSISHILEVLSRREDIVPTFYLKRIKTDKYYYTFCSSEASKFIVRYLKLRRNLSLNDRLFDFTDASLLSRFQKINDDCGWGFKGRYRFFRSHALRKFHASNIGLSAEYVDALQGRSKNAVHEAYIKTNPEKLKGMYEKAMDNVIICRDRKKAANEEFHITINVFLSDRNYSLM